MLSEINIIVSLVNTIQIVVEEMLIHKNLNLYSAFFIFLYLKCASLTTKQPNIKNKKTYKIVICTNDLAFH